MSVLERIYISDSQYVRLFIEMLFGPRWLNFYSDVAMWDEIIWKTSGKRVQNLENRSYVADIQ